MKLMIVDDSEIIRISINEWSQSLNLDVVAMAGNGREAINMAREHQPDIITMDITMPEMDGMQAMKEILQILPQVKIIIVTALSSSDVALKAMKEGAASFLAKPFTKIELLEIFQEVI